MSDLVLRVNSEIYAVRLLMGHPVVALAFPLSMLTISGNSAISVILTKLAISGNSAMLAISRNSVELLGI